MNNDERAMIYCIRGIWEYGVVGGSLYGNFGQNAAIR